MASRAPALRKEEGRIDWTREAFYIERQVRALQPWPAAYAFLRPGGERPPLKLTLWRAQLREGSGTPGTVLGMDPWTVACGRGALALLEVQAEGKRRLASPEFLRGARLEAGTRFQTGP